ncbi:hypothetical protein [Vibrio metschnikovii]|uniref:hypothetical protein n=1 Tax=Vibrio metschnikovii TaxID=28172 RepID=UPI002FC7D3F0
MIEFLDRPIAFHRAFVKLGIGVTGALLLSQSLYWSKRTSNADSWFYKSSEEWKDETGMTRTEIETARRKLRNLGILEEKKVGVPCRLHYRINTANLFACLQQTSLQESRKQECRNPASMAAENLQAITENTQRLPETTTKTHCVIEQRDGSNSDPTPPNEETGQNSATQKTRKRTSAKTKFPTQFEVTPEMIDWYAKQKDFVLGVQVATDQWRDAMIARGSAYSDWVAAWRNGMRLQNQWARERGTPKGSTGQTTTAQVGQSYREGMDVSKYQLPESRG